jgi:kynurenine formamidase
MERWLDLTLAMADGLETGPGGPRLAIMNRITHAWSAPRYLPPARGGCDRMMLLNEHIGTHVDAPYHFVVEGATIDELPLDRFLGSAVALDLSARDPAIPVDVASIERALEAAGEDVQRGDMLLLRTWAGAPYAPGFLQATSLAHEVGRWGVERGLKAIGVDLPSVDSPGDRSFATHMALLEAGVLIYETLCHLDQLDRPRFFFSGLPWRLVGGSGCPVRAVARLD